MSKEFLSPSHWLQFLALNVDGGMTDEQFREFVRHNLPTVIGYQTAMREAPRTQHLAEPIDEHGDFRDRMSETFSER